MEAVQAYTQDAQELCAQSLLVPLQRGQYLACQAVFSRQCCQVHDFGQDVQLAQGNLCGAGYSADLVGFLGGGLLRGTGVEGLPLVQRHLLHHSPAVLSAS